MANESPLAPCAVYMLPAFKQMGDPFRDGSLEGLIG
jgi:hypothetical protein